MQGDNVTYDIASDVDSRGNFSHYGLLNNQQDPNTRAVSDNFAVFAISRDLGSIKATQAPVVWAVGYTTDPAISYTDLSGAPPTSCRPYYETKYSDDGKLASTHAISCVDNQSKIKSRSLTFSMILAMHPQELKSWTTRYSSLPILSRLILET